MKTDISDLCDIKEFKKGDIVLYQGDKVDGMYVIESGIVELLRDDEVIAHFKDGDFFGATGLLLHERRSATIKVVSDKLVTRFLSKENFEWIKDELGEEILGEVLRRYSVIYSRYIM